MGCQGQGIVAILFFFFFVLIRDPRDVVGARLPKPWHCLLRYFPAVESGLGLLALLCVVTSGAP